MENFKKIECTVNSVNGVNGMFIPETYSRGLVLVNHNVNLSGSNAAYIVAAKCREKSAMAIAKALLRAMLAVEIEYYKVNNTPEAVASKKRAYNPMRSALGGDTVYLCDKNGKIIDDVCFTVRGKTQVDGRPMALRNVFRLTKSQTLYKLVVEQEREWNTPEVQRAVNDWCVAAIQQIDVLENADAAIGRAADATEAEQIAAEKAAKAAEKAAKDAKKDAAEKAAKAA